jgi:hypothetical protein
MLRHSLRPISLAHYPCRSFLLLRGRDGVVQSQRRPKHWQRPLRSFCQLHSEFRLGKKAPGSALPISAGLFPSSEFPVSRSRRRPAAATNRTASLLSAVRTARRRIGPWSFQHDRQCTVVQLRVRGWEQVCTPDALSIQTLERLHSRHESGRAAAFQTQAGARQIAPGKRLHPPRSPQSSRVHRRDAQRLRVVLLQGGTAAAFTVEGGRAAAFREVQSRCSVTAMRPLRDCNAAAP